MKILNLLLVISTCVFGQQNETINGNLTVTGVSQPQINGVSSNDVNYSFKLSANYNWAAPFTFLGYGSSKLIEQENGNDYTNFFANGVHVLKLKDNGAKLKGNLEMGQRLDNKNVFIGKPTEIGTFANSNWIGFRSTALEDYITFGTHKSGTSGGERMRIDALGNVGIGTTDTHGARLAINGDTRVQGRVYSKEVHVKTSAWPDYVFADDYELPSLESTEQFIKENKHLPNIPSEAEVKKNGVNVGDMQAKLLQKIEELTLHMIEMKKENNELKKRLSKLEGK